MSKFMYGVDALLLDCDHRIKQPKHRIFIGNDIPCPICAEIIQAIVRERDEWLIHVQKAIDELASVKELDRRAMILGVISKIRDREDKPMHQMEIL